MVNVCNDCVYLKESKSVSFKCSCRHEAFLYVQTSIVEHMFAAQAHTIECGHTNMPQPPPLNEIAWACRDLPEIQVEFIEDYSGDGRNQWPFMFLLEDIISCTGKRSK